MNLITWDEKFSVHITQFDAEHKKLIRILNSLIQAVVEKRANEVLSPLLDQLIVYTETHFASEESAMRKYSFPGFEEHRTEHENFKMKVLAFQKDFRTGKALLSISVLKFLYEWLLFHIQGADAQYSDFFRNQGMR